MRNYSIFFLVLISGLASELLAQECAGTAAGNTSGADGRFFLMRYDNQADRDAALALINSITIDGMTYNVGAHPTGNRTIRTATPAQPAGTFPVSFTGVVTLNPSGVSCEYTASVLPIALTYFNAVAEKSAIVIKWETAREINNEGFEIQYSADGRNFETITWVKGAGSTNETQHYEIRLTDYLKGINYYRLKQIDYDGVFVLSPIVAVNVKASNIVRLERNVLTQGQEVILLNANNGAFEIFNAAGSKVESGPIEAQNQSISTAGFNAGMYFIRTDGGNIIKFIIK